MDESDESDVLQHDSQCVEKDKESFIILDSDDENPVHYHERAHEPLIIDGSDESDQDDGNSIGSENTSKDSELEESFQISRSTIRRKVTTLFDDDSDEENVNYTVSDNDSVHDDEHNDGHETNNDSEKLNVHVFENKDSPSNDKSKKKSDTEFSSTYEDSYSKSASNIRKESPTKHEFSDAAMSFAKQEIGVGNIDPIIAQKRAMLVCNIQKIENQLTKSKLLLSTANLNLLPDGGEKLRQSIFIQQEELAKLKDELKYLPLTKPMTLPQSESLAGTSSQIHSVQKSYKLEVLPPTDKLLGKKAQENLDRERTLTIERLENLHTSLVRRPTEDQAAPDPRGLKVSLMFHQKHALAWLLWREQQKPAGGVLADDMGLGKTLTMIALVMASLAQGKPDDDDDDDVDDEYYESTLHRGGTLVVCPASLLSQWEGEVNNRCKRGTLSLMVYHGNNRETISKRLAQNDMVITTYQLLSRECKTRSVLFKIYWERVILDEAHVIRNHKSQISESVCKLVARKRWALTGTPIQNKEMDMYAILKFLKCSPFDDLRVWKRWVDNKNASGQQRLATVMKTLMLRRTKQELQAKGCLNNLPDKCLELVEVNLDPEEQLVYEKVLVYSRTLFAQFLSQRAEKEHMNELNAGKYDKPSFMSECKKTQFTKAQDRLLSLHADVKAHQILVLLLRLRQVCCHPALIHSMLDQEDVEQNGIIDTDGVDMDFLSQVNNLTIDSTNDTDEDKDREIKIDERLTQNLLTSKNPVFKPERQSSKMRSVLTMVQEIVNKGDKVIVVSQWTSMLNVVAMHLDNIKGATYRKFCGTVAVKDRQEIVNTFNEEKADPKILLLSLTAGGVGLNLVGGNHLILLDVHWNPQLESQAQDRIYRFGQKKDVYIYKYICKNTIEERIKLLQDKKLEIADNLLNGAGTKMSSKLTIDDLKSLFSI